MPSFKLESSDSCDKLKGLLNVVGSHFESLKKATYIKVLDQFNAMRLKIFLKKIEDDRVTLVTSMKTIRDALDDGGRTYNHV